MEILSTEISSKNYLPNLFRGIYVADLACDDGTQMSLSSRAARMSLRLKSLAAAIDGEASSPEALERATLSLDSLHVERHFSGSGSKDDPIKFVDGVPYYEAFYRYCSQFNLDATKSRIEHSGGVFLDAIQDGEGLFIFFRRRFLA